MKALPWYFGGPSEVILTWTSCCDGLHYGVYGLWGSAPTSPTGLWDKCLSPTGSPDFSALVYSRCCSSYTHEYYALLKNEIKQGIHSLLAWRHLYVIVFHILQQ